MRAALALWLMASAAPAQSVCGPIDKLAGSLSSKYGELPGPLGIVQSMLMRVYVNKTTGTFTILIVRPDGMACVSIAGEGWQPGDAPDKPEKSL